MKHDELMKDIQCMDAVMGRLANRADIWQDRYIYWIAKAVRDILLEMARREKDADC